MVENDTDSSRQARHDSRRTLRQREERGPWEEESLSMFTHAEMSNPAT